MSIHRKIAFLCENRLFILAFLAISISLVMATNAYAIGKIAFTSNRDGNSEIYVMNADGTGQTNLTNNPAHDSCPAWSPDGSKIAFMSTRDVTLEIYVMNADGSGVTNLTNSNPGDDVSPDWSPDGSKIAFASSRGGANYQIYVMNADGTSQTNLSNNSAYETDPAWSPDGSKIAFASHRDGNFQIYVMNADGTGQTNLSNNSVNDFRPAWSPDGSKIAFTSSRDGLNEIYVMNADGTGQTNLSNNPAWDSEATWSPDGSKIAFASARDGNDEIYVMNADGTGQTNLSNNPAHDYYPDWASGTGTESWVNIDIKPGSCPNPLNLVSKGILPIAILGTAELDVTTIDPPTIKLNRESVDCSVSPLRWSYEDVATPFEGALCDCHDLNGDGYMDLTLKFDNQDVVDCLELTDVAGDTIPLIVTGNLKKEHGGTPIIGEDCMRTIFKCHLNPDATVIPRGGTLGFQATVTNDTDGSGSVLFATNVTMPNGKKYPPSGYLIGSVQIALTPYGSKSKHKLLNIPENAPLGIYTYHGYVGNFGKGIYHECTFDFEVIP